LTGSRHEATDADVNAARYFFWFGFRGFFARQHAGGRREN
jgi:hypothetical protein